MLPMLLIGHENNVPNVYCLQKIAFSKRLVIYLSCLLPMKRRTSFSSRTRSILHPESEKQTHDPLYHLFQPHRDSSCATDVSKLKNSDCYRNLLFQFNGYRSKHSRELGNRIDEKKSYDKIRESKIYVRAFWRNIQ
jgi:hypothetical protein